MPRIDEVGLNPTVLAFALAATAATAVVFGMLPVLRLAGASPVDALRQQSQSTTGARRLAQLRGALAAAQVALALTLLAGAGILVASFHRLQRVDLGVRVDGVLTFAVHLPTIRYDGAQRAAFQETLASRLKEIQGVSAAGGISRLPATGSYHPWNTHIRSGPLAGRPVDRSRAAMQQRVVSGDALAALDVAAARWPPVRRTATTPAAPRRAVVSANLARAGVSRACRYDAVVGQRIAVAAARDGHRRRRRRRRPGRLRRADHGRLPRASPVRRQPELGAHPGRRQRIGHRWTTCWPPCATWSGGIDPELVVHRPAPMADVVGRGASQERFTLVLLGAFAARLAGPRRRRPLRRPDLHRQPAHDGDRRFAMALGATAAQVRGLVLRQAAVVVGVGLAAGARRSAAARAVARRRSLFEVAPSDPRDSGRYGGAADGRRARAPRGCPARRAARIEPRIAMQDAQ